MRFYTDRGSYRGAMAHLKNQRNDRKNNGINKFSLNESIRLCHVRQGEEYKEVWFDGQILM